MFKIYRFILYKESKTQSLFKNKYHQNNNINIKHNLVCIIVYTCIIILYCVVLYITNYAFKTKMLSNRRLSIVHENDTKTKVNLAFCTVYEIPQENTSAGEKFKPNSNMSLSRKQYSLLNLVSAKHLTHHSLNLNKLFTEQSFSNKKELPTPSGTDSSLFRKA